MVDLFYHQSTIIMTLTAVALSERETIILQLLAQGLTKSEVAEKIYISKWTVAFHVNEMLFRFGCSNTTALCVYAAKNNLI